MGYIQKKAYLKKLIFSNKKKKETLHFHQAMKSFLGLP